MIGGVGFIHLEVLRRGPAVDRPGVHQLPENDQIVEAQRLAFPLVLDDPGGELVAASKWQGDRDRCLIRHIGRRSGPDPEQAFEDPIHAKPDSIREPELLKAACKQLVAVYRRVSEDIGRRNPAKKAAGTRDLHLVPSAARQ